ncbi:universal stress protein [Williamsia sp.]|uniref:universal stress protein n=1 Tax=Williamsia sp. TaxID=1872085 RepID=UPI001A29A1D3|nr:universal stress protein [Williamsia sp.]MBJ7287935.1 universal stress protein [Williamsia sp.]
MDYKQRPVLVGVDGSKTSLAAVRWAAREAIIRSTPLRIVMSLEEITPSLGYYAVPQSYFDEMKVTGDATLTEAARIASAIAVESGAELDVHTDLLTGPARPALIELSASMQMLVLGTRGYDVAAFRSLGSVTSAVAAHARCPVTVVHQEPEDYKPARFGRVVVGVDGSEQSDAALDLAFEEAALRGANLEVAHGYYDLTPMIGAGMGVTYDAIKETQEVALSERLMTWRDRYPDLPVTERVVAANPVPVLANSADEADLVVVGSRGRGGFTGMLLGSTSRALMHSVTCPLTIVH